MKLHKLVSSALLSAVLLSAGASLPEAHVNASHVHHPKQVVVVKKANLSKRQAKRQDQNKKLVKNVKKNARKDHKHNWFKDGLSKRQLRARAWIVRHESGGHWNILSYGHVCVGYFQLNPAYLGYKHGKVNLNHKHQVKVADRYAKARYGGWVNAKRFWQAHNWY